MKKTDLFTKIAAGLVFIAIAVYLGVYFYRSVQSPVLTAPAVETTLRTEVQVSGIIVRDETVLESGAAYMSLSAEEGKRVAKGSALAVTYGTAAAAQRAEQIRELELEIRQAETLLSGLVSADEVTEKDSAIRSSAENLAAAVARHDLTTAEEAGMSLESLLLLTDAQSATAGDLIIMRSELEKLKNTATGDTEDILAPESGIFSSVLDGFEHLKSEDFYSLTPDELKELTESEKEVSSKAFGKLVSGTRWYFAAAVGGDDYELLRDSLVTGQTVYLDLGRYYSGSLPVRVEDVGRELEGSRVVLFSCSRAMEDTLVVRSLTATIAAEEHSGLRVPKEAVYTEETEEGETLYYLYTLTGVQAEKKYINIVWETDDYYLAEPGDRGSMLRVGNEIIVSAKDLADGKIME